MPSESPSLSWKRLKYIHDVLKIFIHLLYMFIQFYTVDFRVFLCDFHRERAWLCCLSSFSNGMRDNEKLVLPLLRKIASSESKEDYLKYVGELKSSDLWNNEKGKPFRDWIEKTWLSAYTVSFEFLCQFHQTLYPMFASVQL